MSERYEIVQPNKGHLKLEGVEIAETKKAEINIIPILDEEGQVKEYEGRFKFQYYDTLGSLWIKQKFIDLAVQKVNSLKFEITNCSTDINNFYNFKVYNLGNSPIKIQEINAENSQYQIFEVEVPFDLDTLKMGEEIR